MCTWTQRLLSPTSLVDDGFGIDAPFLISLPFLLKRRGRLVLDQKQLRLSEPNCVIKVHLGPSGALRVPMRQFDDQVLRSLKSSQQVLERSEFEIFGLTSESSSMMEREAQSRGAISSQFPTSDLYHRHGGSGQPARDGKVFSAQQAWARILKKLLYLIYQMTPLLEVLIRRAGHQTEEEMEIMSGMSDSSWSRIRGALSVGGSPQHREYSPTSRASTTGTSSSNNVGDIPGIQMLLGTPHCMLTTKTWISNTEANNERIFARCPKPQGHQCRFVQWYENQPLDDLTAWRYREDEEGNTQSAKEILTAMIQDNCQHKNITKSGTNGVQEKKTCRNCMKVWITQPIEKETGPPASSKDFAEFQKFMEWKRIQGKEVGPKFQRKVHHALKRTISFWKEIQALFTTCGVDGQTTSDHISRLNQGDHG